MNTQPAGHEAQRPGHHRPGSAAGRPDGDEPQPARQYEPPQQFGTGRLLLAVTVAGVLIFVAKSAPQLAGIAIIVGWFALPLILTLRNSNVARMELEQDATVAFRSAKGAEWRKE